MVRALFLVCSRSLLPESLHIVFPLCMVTERLEGTEWRKGHIGTEINDDR